MSDRLQSARKWKRIVFFILPTLVACNADEAKHAGQTLATVNGVDITVHQVNAELRAAPPAGTVPQQRALEQVIDRALLAEQAVSHKLDRDPAVLMAIERSKEQILAQAYLQSRVSRTARPDRAEVDSYIQAHPELFANRKLYSLRYLVVPVDAFDARLSASVDKAGSLDELAAALRAGHIEFSENHTFQSSAELPPQLLSNLDLVASRPVFTMRDGSRALLASLAVVKETPVAGDDAVRQAEQYLAGRKSVQLAQDEVSRLRQGARIAYAKGSEPQAVVPTTRGSGGKSATENGISGLH